MWTLSLNDDIRTESLKVKSIAGRMIPVNGIVYSTNPEEVSFNYPNFGKYQVVSFMGDKYFAGYTENFNGNGRIDFNDIIMFFKEL